MEKFNLIIVESPKKADTIKKFLGKEWKVIATKGHIVNLPKNELGIEIKDNKFFPKWVYEKGKREIVKKIKELASKANRVYIATDDDREGEKIAYDVVDRTGIRDYKRVTFLEITKDEIQKKIRQGRDIDLNIVKAAIARRLIDRYIGYPISTIIKHAFKTQNLPYVPRGVGRVISPSLHILVELEKQIESFIPEEHYKVLIEYIKDGIIFRVTNPISFLKERKKELDDFLYVLNHNPHIVSFYKQKTEDKAPPKPLITSTMQYGAWYLFRFKPKKTMKLAQELYESGLITYHRTDSVRISEEAYLKMVQYLYNKYGEEYVVSTQREYKTDSSAQDAHEAIRPTYFDEKHEPDNLLKHYPFLNEDHKKLYEFIWYRTIVTQIKNSVYDRSVVEVDIGGNVFKATANHRIFDGWEKFRGDIIKASIKQDEDDWKEKNVVLPELTIGEELIPARIETYDYVPHRPRRYGIGRFITTLSNNGIARPSTLDGIIENLEGKNYIAIHKGILYPEVLGIKVDEWLEEHADWLIDIELAKKFEDQLDEVEKGKFPYDELIKEYISYVEYLQKKFNINALNNSPTPAQIELLKKIQNEKEVPEDVFFDKNKATKFLDEYFKANSLGKCPECKSLIKENDSGFYCSNRECRFVLWKNYLKKFFEKFDLPANEDFIKEFVKTILKRKKVYFENLKGKKGNFNAYLVLRKENGYWGIKLSFPKKEPSEEDKQISKQLLLASSPKEELIKEVHKLKEEKRLLEDAALKDRLTRAFNRTAFEEDVKKLERVKDKINLHIAFIDADKFKSVNDTYGHEMGDEVLKTITNIVFEFLREKQIPARFYRYGGEEFVLIAREGDKKTFLNFLEELRKRIYSHTYKSGEREFNVSVSIGYASPETISSSSSIKEAIKKADEAVYIAKRTGRNKVVTYKDF